jgi:hypothetical protein
LLAINPQNSPATPTAVQVNGSPITLPNLGDEGADHLIRSATSYNAGTTSFSGIKEDTIIFTSGGKVYKASTLLSNGVPGVAGTNVPQQVSSLTTARPCGMGSTGDLMNTSNRIVGFEDAGGDNLCDTSDNFIVLMHLNDGAGTAPLSLPVGTTINGDNFAALNVTTGALSQVFVTNTAGDLQWIDTTLAAPTNVTGGAAIGGVEIVGQQADKVFLASSTRLYIYTPSTNTLSAPVVTADAGTTWVARDIADHATTSTAIYLVQTNGGVYRVPFTTTAGQTVGTKHFTAPVGTIAGRIAQTTNKIMILTGTNPNNQGGQTPCATTNPTTCNNGIIAVDKTAPNISVLIEAPTLPKAIYFMTSWNNFVTYSFFDGTTGGAFARIEDASSSAVNVSFGSWGHGTRESSLNITTFAEPTPVNQTIIEFAGAANGSVVKVTTSPTGPAATMGTVSDPGNLLQGPPFFNRSVDGSILGFANLAANPANSQPFLVDTMVSTLTKITTPAAPWHDPSEN